MSSRALKAAVSQTVRHRLVPAAGTASRAYSVFSGHRSASNKGTQPLPAAVSSGQQQRPQQQQQQQQQQPQRRQFSWLRTYAGIDATQVLESSRTVAIQWDDGHASNYDFTWLRVNCPSALHESGQKTLTPGDVDTALKPTEISNSRWSNEIVIGWSDGHTSEYKAGWLRAHGNSPSELHERSHGSWPVAVHSWDSIQKVGGQEYMNDDVTLYRALKKVNRTGLCRLDDVGTEERTVLDLARRTAPVSHEMLYGDSHDIVSQVKPRNLAFSSEALPLHMDLVYYESPPGLQFIHCVEFDDRIKGGDSTFLDSFEAARHFRDHNPEMFDVLARVPATFHKVRTSGDAVEGDDRNKAALEPAYMVYQRPHFEVDPNGEILGVRWAPIFEGALVCPPQDVGPYYEAYRAFQELIEDSQFAKDRTLVKRMKPGQCIMFNNRRMLHGRTAFSGEGRRLLQGTYVNIDDYMSKLRTLHIAQPPSDDPVKNTLTRAGNGSLAHVDY